MSVLGSRLRRPLRWARSSKWDIVWVVFVGLNLAAMRLLPEWQTVPFLAIWVSLTLIYGFRLWRLQPAMLTLTVLTLATGGIIGVQVIRGQQDADYLAEVPLIALMFLVMVWHGQRRLTALEERLGALDELERLSRENLRLLEQQRMFLLDASHELGTPITVALGHAELIEQAAADKEVVEDARVVVGELGRLRTLAARLLLLASAGSPGFLDLGPVAVDSVVMDALGRWGYTPRRWRLGEVTDATVEGDRDRLAVALDALVENAIAHTAPDDQIELGARVEDGSVVFAVTDSGCGIPEEDLERIFGRFSRATPYRSREVGGFGLGLPTVRAIAEAHRGSVRVQSTVGKGARFELVIPAAAAPDRAVGQAAMNLPDTGRLLGDSDPTEKGTAMRLTVTTFITLDGVYQAPGGPGEDDERGFRHGGWSFPYADADFGAAMTGWFDNASAFLLGRKTYDIFAGYWPKVTDEADPIASRLNALPKYVVSRGRPSLGWQNSHLVTGDVPAEIASLKQDPGDELQVHGSGNLVHTLIRQGLADEYRLLVYPVLLGSGKRIFPDGDIGAALRLVDSKPTSSGVQILTYEPAGPVQYGSFA